MTPKTTLRGNKTGILAHEQTLLSIPIMSRTSAGTHGMLHNAELITTKGLRKVQDLQAGDQLVSRSSGIVPIYRIEQQSLVARAVYVLAGSIGHHRLKRDTMIPYGQPVLIRDWRAKAFVNHCEMIAHASSLIDGEFWRDIGWQPMTAYRIFCKAPQIIYADGMEMVTADDLLEPASGSGNAV